MADVDPRFDATMKRATSSKSGSRSAMLESLTPPLIPSPSATGSGSSSGCSGPGWSEMYFVMLSTSGVSTKAHCTRTGSVPLRKSISPRPTSWLAPGRSRIVRESICAPTRNAILPGKFALILPVMMVVVGR